MAGLVADLTILSVCYRSEPLLRLHRELMQRLNPGRDFVHLVVDNAPPPRQRGLQDLGFRLIEGFPPPQSVRGAGSYHHAQALNRGVQLVETRFLLVLDPDFFVLRKNWIDDVLSHMDSEKLVRK